MINKHLENENKELKNEEQYSDKIFLTNKFDDLD